MQNMNALGQNSMYVNNIFEFPTKFPPFARVNVNYLRKFLRNNT